MSDRSDEPLGVIALISALVMLAMRCGRQDQERVRILPSRMIAGALLLAWVQFSGWLGYPLLIGLLAVAIIAISLSMPQGKAGVIALLVLSLPLIASLDFFAGYPLRLVAAEITTGILKLCGIPVERAGVMLIDGERLVGIDPPCAGIRMLWTSCFVAALLAARLRLSWICTLSLILAAVGFVVVGNGVRAALVFLPESGRADWPDWAHSGAGLLVHGGILAGVFGVAAKLESIGTRGKASPWRRMARPAAAVGFVLLMLMAGVFASNHRPKHGMVLGDAGEWPAMLDGVALIPQRLGTAESRFARSFPGFIRKFAWGDAGVIMRRTDRATRMMHPSGDCLKAAGFEIQSEPVFRDADARLWGASVALRDGKRWLIHERYISETGDAWTDASEWYWQAQLHPEQGPWTAITVIRPDEQRVSVCQQH